MSEIKPNESAPAPAEDNGEEKDWAAAKAFFDNLKTHKPRPVSIRNTSLCVHALFLHHTWFYMCKITPSLHAYPLFSRLNFPSSLLSPNPGMPSPSPSPRVPSSTWWQRGRSTRRKVWRSMWPISWRMKTSL